MGVFQGKSGADGVEEGCGMKGGCNGADSMGCMTGYFSKGKRMHRIILGGIAVLSSGIGTIHHALAHTGVSAASSLQRPKGEAR
jgi:hypothetical protein